MSPSVFRPPSLRSPHCCARLVIAPRSGADADYVRPGCREIHYLADRARILDEGNLAPLWRLGLPLVMALPLPDKPDMLLNVHDEPVGSYV